MDFTESPLTAVKRETLRRLNERARLKEINAELLAALEASQPLLQVAMLSAQKVNDADFLERLQTTFASNRAAIAKAKP